MKNILFGFLSLFFVVLSISCGNLEKEIDLELPAYEGKLVVECYLRPGLPFTCLLSRSVSYFDQFNLTEEDFLNILEDSAEVRISHNGEVYKLDNQLFPIPTTMLVSNYVNLSLVPEDYNNDFSLEIITKDGEKVTATTRILPVVPIDSVVVEFDEQNKSLARVLTYFQDDPNTKNFYRRMLHFGNLEYGLEFYFQTDDDFVDDGTVVFGSGFDYLVGDTVINSIYHIDQTYYNFLQSVDGAVDANGNPFAQPGALLTNLEGNAIGIFTGLSFDREITVIEK